MPASENGRLHSLDGLRGVAALIVMVHHSLLTIPAFAAGYFTAYVDMQDHGPAVWLATYTPLHLVWDGSAAVAVFFVLSGVVLALPVLRSTRFTWRSYYPQRLVRLYVPVIAAVIFGSVLATVFDRTATTDVSLWIATSPGEVTSGTLTKDLTLIDGSSRVISPLWSLQWEIIFSLLLPLYVWVGRSWRWLWLLKLAGLLALIGIGQAWPNNQYLTHLPVFGIGVIFAVEFDRVRALASRISPLGWTLLGVLAVLGCTSHWTFEVMGQTETTQVTGRLLMVAGASLLVFVAAFAPGVVDVLSSAPVQWLGRISFSLYLVHEPIVIALAVTFGTGGAWAVLPIMVIAGPLAGYVFYRFVEQPSHRLAKRVGGYVRRHDVRVA